MTKIWLFDRGNDDNLHIVDRYAHTDPTYPCERIPK